MSNKPNENRFLTVVLPGVSIGCDIDLDKDNIEKLLVLVASKGYGIGHMTGAPDIICSNHKIMRQLFKHIQDSNTDDR